MQERQLVIRMVLWFSVRCVAKPGLQVIVGFWKSRDEKLLNKYTAVKMLFQKILVLLLK